MGHDELGYLVDLAEPAHLATAAAAERLGYGALWVAGGQLLAGLEPLAKLLEATERIVVGSAIAQAESHPAETLTRLFQRTEQRFPGRLLAGIGTQGPIRRAEAYLAELDAGGLPVSRRLLAALGPRKLDLASTRTAGAIAHLVSPEDTARIRARIGPEARLVVLQMAVFGTDQSPAMPSLRFLATVPGYVTNLRRMGFTEERIATLDPGLVETVLASGTPSAIAERFRAHLDAGADQVVLCAYGTENEELLAELAAAL